MSKQYMPVNSVENYSENAVRLLQDMGLTELEATVYTFIFQKGGATTRDILRTLSLRQPQLYDITSGLERKGFIYVISGRPQKYKAVNPLVLYEKRENDLKKMRGAFLEWTKQNEQKIYTSEPEIFISRNYNSFLMNTLQNIKSAKNFILIHTTLDYLNDFLDSLKIKSKEGVRIFLLLFGDDYDRAFLNDIIKQKIFSNIRKLKIGKFFAVISDDFYSSFMPRNVLFNESNQRYGYIFKDHDMTWFLTHNFFSGWFQSLIVDEKIPEPPIEYSNQRIAMADLIILKNNGMDAVEVVVEGLLRTNDKYIQVKGKIEKLTISDDIIGFTLAMSDGKKFTIGGFDSKIEDVIAKNIKILSAH